MYRFIGGRKCEMKFEMFCVNTKKGIDTGLNCFLITT